MPQLHALFDQHLDVGVLILRAQQCQVDGHDLRVVAGEMVSRFFDWGVALQRHTDTMRNDLSSLANMGTFRGGFDPVLTVDAALLAQVRSATYVLWGDHDPYGDASVARRFVDALPDAQLEMLPDAGHLCWFDDPDHVAAAVRSHLRADTTIPA